MSIKKTALLVSTIALALVSIVAVAAILKANSDTGATESESPQSETSDNAGNDDQVEFQESDTQVRNPIDPFSIPIGDGNVSDEPKVGYSFACNTNFREGGARHIGDWYDEENGTWSYPDKVRVQGDIAWPSASSSITVAGSQRIIETNGLPGIYNTGIFPIARDDPAYQYDTNPNAIGVQSYRYSVALNPQLSSTAYCTPLGPIGVMNDGVVLFNALDDAGLDAVAHETQDQCDGHPSGNETYHYHSVAGCTLDNASDMSELVGYALDGFGIYVERDENGDLLTNDDLDECHGRISTIEWDGQDVEMYHYVATLEYPYTIGCFKGLPVVGPAAR